MILNENSKVNLANTERFRVVDDRYKLLHSMGSGRFGEVHLAYDLKEGKLVTVKELRELDSIQNLENFLTEIETLISLKKRDLIDQVPTILEFEIKPETGAYYVMNLSGISNLFEFADANSHFSPGTIKLLFRQIVKTVAFLHSIGYAHLDIKPENVLVTDEGRTVLCDFGSARKLDSRAEGFIYGSTAYLAPEGLHANMQDPPGKDLRELDLRKLDSFALGVVLFVMVFKSNPFGQPTTQDPYYKRFVGDPQAYWKIFSGVREIPNNLRFLLENLLTKPPFERLLPQDILKHSWLNEAADDHKSARLMVNELRTHITQTSIEILQGIEERKKQWLDEATMKMGKEVGEILRRFLRLNETALLRAHRKLIKSGNTSSESLSSDSQT